MTFVKWVSISSGIAILVYLQGKFYQKIDEDGCKLKLCSQWLYKLSIVNGHGADVQNFAISLNKMNENVFAHKYEGMEE